MNYTKDGDYMEIRVLKYFIVIAREKSFSKAANILHVTQPTLSRQIKELEEEYGTTFLKRTNHSVELTNNGLLFRKYAQEILDLVNEAETSFLTQSYLAGDIFIGCGEGNTNRFIIKAIAKMQERYPDVKFHITSGNAQQIMNQLRTGSCDMGIVFDPVDLTQYDFIKFPYYETWGVWMRKDSELAQYQTIQPHHLKNKPTIISSQDMIKNEIAGWIGGNDRKFRIVATYNLIYNALLMVEEGMGYAIGFDQLYPYNEQSELCFRPLSPKLKTQVNVIWKKYQVFPPHIEVFLQILKEEMK